MYQVVGIKYQVEKMLWGIKSRFNTYYLLLTTESKGFIAITSVLVISAVVMAISITVSLLGIGEGQTSLALTKGEDNLTQVEGCIEDALLKARSSSTFGDPVGTPVSIARPSPEPSCSVTVVSKTGSGTVTWDMNVTVSTTAYKRTVNVDFTRSSTGLSLITWKEI